MAVNTFTSREAYDRDVIKTMKPLMQAIEAKLKEEFPASATVTDDQRYAREAVLSAVGTLGSADTRRLDNPDYARTIHESTKIVTGNCDLAKTDRTFQKRATELVASNPDVVNGLAQLEAAILSHDLSRKAVRGF